ncbi:hypothetical protein GGX14DRAFT_406496 [Mycena pura]|uniref:Uncharacterized protein n=1 Tax=Mycena pura TaxID=153505 RepID=A0AAD6UQ70_9AGAR|nr:hypothetical protein GGX14DRAFT_406496 [Mycena pura]
MVLCGRPLWLQAGGTIVVLRPAGGAIKPGRHGAGVERDGRLRVVRHRERFGPPPRSVGTMLISAASTGKTAETLPTVFVLAAGDRKHDLGRCGHRIDRIVLRGPPLICAAGLRADRDAVDPQRVLVVSGSGDDDAGT